MVVEGATDRRALLPFLIETAVVVPAGGKDNVICAFRRLEHPLREAVIFLLDCDGGVPPSLKGHAELVITTNRDIEADLLIELKALARVAYELLGGQAENPGVVVRLRDEVLDTAIHLTSIVGVVQAAAITLAVPTRVRDARSGKRRKLVIQDLPRLPAWIRDGAPSVRELADEMSRTVGWSADQTRQVREAAKRLYDAPCGRHGTVECPHCRPRNYARGHHIVDAVAVILEVRHSIGVDRKALDQLLRVAADKALVAQWRVAERIRQWETASGRRVLA